MTTETVELWSHIFLSEEDEKPTCSLDKHAWTALINRHEGCNRLFAKIDVEDKTLYSALGSYTDCGPGESATRLILPRWGLDVLSALGMGEVASVTWLTEDAFPPATRIVLRPHDSAFYHADAKEELEVALTGIGVLQQGQTIMVSLKALGDYPISFDIVELEPANIVLADGEEVAIEFEAALDAAVEESVERPDTPIPESAFATMIPEPPKLPEAQGRTLGGTTRYMADGRPWNPYRDSST